ncbi:mannitol-1-phosphate 5-dehydrogenase [Paenibacillus paeoniae]|uniref:Mannitol-1-phosphate 5-dehydrogenase n=1 Tax=Paenibacillus paeoniae TaxID=2292705 RepID=A0A371PFE3_9BACL|nr:mannitol-1-phosphate 5-dehydrogenase [Paenibacillus paeoniae]REK74356.1 mannitol-1-phosphate 5-dehydrogenase [Paenibacillus paeoniae]
MKAVHFGPGNIGRGFIGLLLSQSGFEVTFVVRNERQLNMLQQKKKYIVTLANEDKDKKVVSNVSAISSQHRAEVARAIAETDLVTTAVGLGALKHLAESIAEGIELRLRFGVRKPLHIIACENAMDGSSQLRSRVMKHLSPGSKALAEKYVAFPNTAVDRIVPIQDGSDSLQVTVEAYYEWVIDKSAMLEGFPEIKGVKYVDQLAPYIERKLFTVNTGHCVAAYHGYLEGYETIQEAMEDEGLKRRVVSAMQETGRLLTSKYHWEKENHSTYINRMLDRFTNPLLSDDIVRVGRSPLRKLSLNDRLVRPALQAHGLGFDIPHLTSAIAAALLFDHKEDPEAVSLQSELKLRGVDEVITQVMGIPQKHAIHPSIVSRYHEMRRVYGASLRASGS